MVRTLAANASWSLAEACTWVDVWMNCVSRTRWFDGTALRSSAAERTASGLAAG